MQFRIITCLEIKIRIKFDGYTAKYKCDEYSYRNKLTFIMFPVIDCYQFDSCSENHKILKFHSVSYSGHIIQCKILMEENFDKIPLFKILTNTPLKAQSTCIL